MKFLVVVQFMLVVSMTTFSFNKHQNVHSVSQQETDRKAEFVGGTSKMNVWMKENLRYPKKNLRYGIVRVQFTVKKNGKLSDFIIVKGINEDMNFAAIECLQGMPLWNPAIKSGKKVNEQVTLPVKFTSEQ